MRAKKKKTIAVNSDGYKQTDLSRYFMIRGNIFLTNTNKKPTTMLMPSTTIKDETEDAEDNEAVINELLESANRAFNTNNLGSRDLTNAANTDLGLPLQLPKYTFSEESDSEVWFDSRAPSVVTVSSDEEDFKYIAKKRRTQFKTSALRSCQTNKSNSNTRSAVSVSSRCSSSSSISIGINRAVTPVQTTRTKVKPRILTQYNSDLNISLTNESTNTDFLSISKNNTTTNDETIIQSSSFPKIYLKRFMDTTKPSKAKKLNTTAEEWNPIAVQLFKKIVTYIQSHFYLKTMFTFGETQMLQKFFSMEHTEYKYFCLKLFTRLQKWYNIFKLRSLLNIALTDPEVRDMYDCLLENGFVDVDFSSESCVDLLNNMLKTDIKDICKSFKMKITTETKPELIQKLLNNCNHQTTLTFVKNTEEILNDRIKEKMGICVKLNSILYNLFNKVHLLYTFVVSEFKTVNDLYFYLSQIEVKAIVLPNIHFDMNTNIFLSIPEFTRFSRAHECKQAILNSYEKKEINHILELCELAYDELQEIFLSYEVPKPVYLMRFTAGYQYTSALSLGAQFLTRHYPDKAQLWFKCLIGQDQYCTQYRGLWYEQLIIIQYNYLKQYETAVVTLIEALDRNDLKEVDYHDLSSRAEKIKKCSRYKIPTLQHNRICFVQPISFPEFPFVEIHAQCIPDNKAGKKRFYIERVGVEQRILTVEQVALDHYLQNGYLDGMHCEGGLLVTLFFVLFWDIIYAPVPNTFILEIQYLPLDLMSTDFYTNRKNLIEKRLNDIKIQWSSEQLEKFILEVWREHSHERSFIRSRLVPNVLCLYDIVLCIGRVCLAKIFERLARDFKTYNAGLPDLFLWNVDLKICKFVEVKGQHDKLSTKQKLWLSYLLSLGADAEVCHVHTIGSRSRLKRDIKQKKVGLKNMKKLVKPITE